MSVPEPKRSKSKLDIFVQAKTLTKYTLEITSNEKVFCPQYKDLINEINTLSIDIHVNLWTANHLNLFSETAERLKYQNKAIGECIRLLAIIDVAQKVFHLSYKRVSYWGDMVVSIRNGIRSWKQSDKSRIGK